VFSVAIYYMSCMRFLNLTSVEYGSLDSSISVATACSLEGRGSVPGRGKGFLYTPQRPDRLWGHPVSYPMGTGGSFPEGKAAGVWSWPLTSIYYWGQERWSYTFTPQYVFMS
jgi:hypothetical protein